MFAGETLQFTEYCRNPHVTLPYNITNDYPIKAEGDT